MAEATLLRIDSIDFVDWAVRGISVTLEPIPQSANLARDCRGTLVDISVAQFQKYKFTISCTDQDAPVLTDVWPGKIINVDLIPNMGVVNSTDGVLSLNAMVTNWQVTGDEYGASVAWQLDGEQR